MAGFIRVTQLENGDVHVDGKDFERLIEQNDLYRQGLGKIVNAKTVATSRYLAATTLAGLTPQEAPPEAVETE